MTDGFPSAHDDDDDNDDDDPVRVTYELDPRRWNRHLGIGGHLFLDSRVRPIVDTTTYDIIS
jgi:hypothetical protein